MWEIAKPVSGALLRAELPILEPHTAGIVVNIQSTELLYVSLLWPCRAIFAILVTISKALADHLPEVCVDSDGWGIWRPGTAAALIARSRVLGRPRSHPSVLLAQCLHIAGHPLDGHLLNKTCCAGTVHVDALHASGDATSPHGDLDAKGAKGEVAGEPDVACCSCQGVYRIKTDASASRAIRSSVSQR